LKKLILIIPFLLFAYRIEIYKWNSKDTFYSFLKNNSLPISLYYNLPNKIKRYVRRIPVGEDIFLLKDNNKIKQALIPLNSKEQLQIVLKNNKYLTKIVPIIYEITQKKASITIKNYLSYDVYKATHLRTLSSKIAYIFSDRIDFRKLPKNTQINLIYEEKLRFGKVKDVKILYAQIKNRYYTINAFLNPKDNRYYDEKAKSLKGMFLQAPLKYKRISSKFGKRFHPIFHKWLMHYGIDYVNRVGTPIKSVADGIVIYKGWIKGYGKSIKIRHKNGYMTLYAHLNGYPKNIYIGKWVKQGQIIGYLGNTGLSTGPHLHFGVMKNNKWINPIKIKKSAKITLYGKQKKEFFTYIKRFTKDYNLALK